MKSADILSICRCLWPIWFLLPISACTMCQKARTREASGKSTGSSGAATNRDYWAIEDAKERGKLPLYKIIPAARPEELTPANGYPKPATFLTWHRSHGDNGGMRYSALDQIKLQKDTQLPQGWGYHSGGGSKNLQCNPILCRDILIAPAP